MQSSEHSEIFLSSSISFQKKEGSQVCGSMWRKMGEAALTLLSGKAVLPGVSVDGNPCYLVQETLGPDQVSKDYFRHPRLISIVRWLEFFSPKYPF